MTRSLLSLSLDAAAPLAAQSHAADFDGSDVSNGQYLTAWRRQPNGTFRFISDGGNPRPAP